MVVKYFGGNCFRLQKKGVSFLFGVPDSKVEADIVLSLDFKKIAKLQSLVKPRNRKEVFWISGPGEYEVNDIDIWNKGKTTWLVEVNGHSFQSGWRVCFMGDGWKVPDSKKVEALGQVDILLLVLSPGKKEAKEAAELIKRVSPQIVIPAMNRESQAELGKDWARDFLDQMDREDLKPEEKLNLKKTELEGDSTIVYWLKEK